MAVFVDLGDEDAEPPLHPPRRTPIAVGNGDASSRAPATNGAPDKAVVAVPPRRNIVAEAFACYPVAKGVAQSIDLDTLDSLARTCRRVHDALIQYRRILLKSTLRCYREQFPSYYQNFRPRNWNVAEHRGLIARNYNLKAGSCARDKVEECRKCGLAVCRNCVIKQPEPTSLKKRHRRLCLSCTKAPLPLLINPLLDPATPIGSEAVQLHLCHCETKGTWLCQPCGRTINSSDADYIRVWRWRNQYNQIGTGIGEADRGVTCGREDQCLGAKEREQETDCDAEDAQNPDLKPWATSVYADLASGGTIAQQVERADAEQRQRRRRPGYARHQVEGIGGKMTNKLLKMVRVGECVPEWEDEKGNRVMAREVEGRARSWCGWCWRPIPGARDLKSA